MLVLGTAGLLIAWQAAPAAPVDLRGPLTQFQTVEQKALETYNDAVRKFQNEQLSQDEFVRVIETQVLPPWRDVRGQFDQIDVQRLAADSRTTVSKLRQYLLLREQAWTAFAAGLKSNDLQRLDEAKQKNETADQLGREVGVGN